MDQAQSLHTRKCFYILGRYHPPDDRQSAVMTEQMYVEELRPADVTQPYPIIFWPGMCQSGVGWITTPDGRPGWANFFLARGYIVYVVDPPERGRSAHLPGSSRLRNVPSHHAEVFWTATSQNGGIWQQGTAHTQWPGTGKVGDPPFDQFMASQLQSRDDYLAVESLARRAGADLLNKIGPAIICTHSQGGAHGWVIADECPELVRAIVALEPAGPPFVNSITSLAKPRETEELIRPYGITMTPIKYDPALETPNDLRTYQISRLDDGRCGLILQVEPARRLSNLARVPVMIVTSETGYHAHYDHATVRYLEQAGVSVAWLNLPEVGVQGNGHFMFVERNCIDIAEKINAWVQTLYVARV